MLRYERHLRISQVARILRVSETTLRKWDAEGGKLRADARSPTGHRLYHPDDVRALLRAMGEPRDWRARVAP